MAKYLDPRADLTFKKVFGEHKHLVISLLNALLPLADGEQVESIEYWPAEKVPSRPLKEKDSIVDVCCRDNNNREFIVEMQMTWTESFKNRVLLNASKAYVAQSEIGEDYEFLQPVYALNFVNSPMNVDSDGYYHHYQLVHHANSKEVIPGLQLVFVELPKFKAQTFAAKKMQVLWLRFLTEINSKTQEAPAELLANPEVSEALKIVEIAAYTPAQMRAYDKFWDNISVYKTLDNARRRSEESLKNAEAKLEDAEAKLEDTEAKLEDAKAEAADAKAKLGDAKAEAADAKAKLENSARLTARRMKAKGFATEDIRDITGLTADEIEKL